MAPNFQGFARATLVGRKAGTAGRQECKGVARSGREPAQLTTRAWVRRGLANGQGVEAGAVHSEVWAAVGCAKCQVTGQIAATAEITDERSICCWSIGTPCAKCVKCAETAVGVVNWRI